MLVDSVDVDDLEWPLRYSQDQLAAFRWLLTERGAGDIPTQSTVHESQELAISVALGFGELTEAGMVTLGPEDGKVTIESPHATIFRACSEFDVQLTVRSATPLASNVFIFIISSVLAEEEVGLELWLRADGSTWVNTWPLDELPIRMVEQMHLPPIPDTEHVAATRIVVPDHITPSDLRKLVNEDGTAEAAVSALLDRAEAYVHVDVLAGCDGELSGGDLRLLVVNGEILRIEPNQDTDSLSLIPVSHEDVLLRHLPALIEGASRA